MIFHVCGCVTLQTDAGRVSPVSYWRSAAVCALISFAGERERARQQVRPQHPRLCLRPPAARYRLPGFKRARRNDEGFLTLTDFKTWRVSSFTGKTTPIRFQGARSARGRAGGSTFSGLCSCRTDWSLLNFPNTHSIISHFSTRQWRCCTCLSEQRWTLTWITEAPGAAGTGSCASGSSSRWTAGNIPDWCGRTTRRASSGYRGNTPGNRTTTGMRMPRFSR